jgi:hypothetical protein
MGRPWHRCHNVRFGATEFNPGLGNGRFHPFRSPEGELVPSLYGASTIDGALSETVFHAVPLRGGIRVVRSSSLLPMVVSTLAATRDLVLAQLHGYGLHRLGVSRAELLDSDADHYSSTVLWAQALHRCRVRIDGLVWVSRLHDTSFALVLFGDRVRREELEVVKPSLPLSMGPGLKTLRRAAEQAGFTLLRKE